MPALMAQRLRENGICAGFAVLGVMCMVWLGLGGFGWTDYETEARPAFEALVHGHLLGFLRLAPAYGGSLILRAPFALLPDLWGGGELAVYRLVALPCLLASALLAVYLLARMRSDSRSILTRAVVLCVCVVNPITLQALEQGHPEELLGACLCIAAVLLASRKRAICSGIVLGMAIANKEWALVAIGPVLLALPSGTMRWSGSPRADVSAWIAAWRRQLLCLASACSTVIVVLAPLTIASRGSFAAGARGVALAPGALFQPWQVWWFFGTHGALVYRQGSAMPGYRVGPTWTGTISHPLVVFIGLGVAGMLWLRRRRTGTPGAVDERDALVLLTLVLLLRCLLDTWDTGYYLLPCLMAAVSSEAVDSRRRAPFLALAGIILPWLGLRYFSAHGASPDLQAALFLIWTMPLVGWLGFSLFGPFATPWSMARRQRANSFAEIDPVGSMPHRATV